MLQSATETDTARISSGAKSVVVWYCEEKNTVRFTRGVATLFWCTDRICTALPFRANIVVQKLKIPSDRDREH